MTVLKNRHATTALSEENRHARLSHSKQLLTNIYPVMLASCSHDGKFVGERILKIGKHLAKLEA